MSSPIKSQFKILFISSTIILSNLASTLSAADLDSLHSSIDSLLKDTFRVRTTTKYVLDGSEAASSIVRVSRTSNEFVYAGDAGWRVKRQLPLTENFREYKKIGTDKDAVLQMMTPSNRPVEPREAISDAIWLETLAAPLEIAQQWSLAPSGRSLLGWLDDLRSLKEPLKNAEGDEITVEAGADKTLKINLKGTIVTDGKTRVMIESTWTITDFGKITDAQLNESLVRSS